MRKTHGLTTTVLGRKCEVRNFNRSLIIDDQTIAQSIGDKIPTFMKITMLHENRVEKIAHKLIGFEGIVVASIHHAKTPVVAAAGNPNGYGNTISRPKPVDSIR